MIRTCQHTTHRQFVGNTFHLGKSPHWFEMTLRQLGVFFDVRWTNRKLIK